MGRMLKIVELDDDTGSRFIPSRREVTRYLVKAAVEVANTSGTKAAMRVEDLSSHGCSIKGEVDWLRLGMILSIVLEHEPPVQAITRWVRGGKAGVEFFRPLNTAQADWQALLKQQGF